MSDYVKIFDTTLRDGEQSPGATMNVDEKIRVARQLEKLGVDIIEAGFPISSKGDFEAVKEIAKIIENSEVAALARATDEDIHAAWEAVQYAKKPRIHTFIATSDIHLVYKLKKNREQVLKEAVDAVKLAKKFTDNVEFSAEDATRSDLDYLCEVFEAVIEAGATTINIPDTVGYTVPWEFEKIVTTVKERVKGIENVTISVHCHNDLGLAVANSLAALRCGARQVECTINGIGERAGNAALEEIVMALRTRHDLFNLRTGIKTELLYPTSRLVSSVTGMPVQPNKAIVGANAFAHEAGIHQDGLLKKKITYEIMTPESVGVPKSSLVLGKHSGRHAFKEKLKELGFELTKEELEVAFARFKELCDKKKRLYDEDIEAIVLEEVYKIPERFKLHSVSVVSGNLFIPCATVKMEVDGKVYQDAAFGNGPVDATINTIRKITRSKDRLLSYVVEAITGGTDAQGSVKIKIEEDGVTVSGKGTDTDIIVASAKAYINALNRMAYIKEKRRRKDGEDTI